jgi:purine catabolism regulator
MCELNRHASESWPAGAKAAIGEQAQGLAGWRLSHRQARAVLPVALRSSEPFVRYADAALLAAVLADELLADSLRRIYIEPLEEGRDGGQVALETLRAYFEAGGNVSSAAAALGVKRHTITNRLRLVEERIGRPLDSCAAELEVALRLRQLGSPT